MNNKRNTCKKKLKKNSFNDSSESFFIPYFVGFNKKIKKIFFQNFKLIVILYTFSSFIKLLFYLFLSLLKDIYDVVINNA